MMYIYVYAQKFLISMAQSRYFSADTRDCVLETFERLPFDPQVLSLLRLTLA